MIMEVNNPAEAGQNISIEHSKASIPSSGQNAFSEALEANQNTRLADANIARDGHNVRIVLPIMFHGPAADRAGEVKKVIEEGWSGQFGKYNVETDVVVVKSNKEVNEYRDAGFKVNYVKLHNNPSELIEDRDEVTSSVIRTDTTAVMTYMNPDGSETKSGQTMSMSNYNDGSFFMHKDYWGGEKGFREMLIHEAGHLFGLDDRYTIVRDTHGQQRGLANKGWAGNIMSTANAKGERNIWEGDITRILNAGSNGPIPKNFLETILDKGNQVMQSIKNFKF